MSKQKAVNYTAEQVAAIEAAAPLNLETAKELAAELGKTYRSVIAKAKSLGVEYVSQPAQAKRVGGATKIQMVEKLESVTGQKLNGMEKATAISIANLVAYFDALDAEESESES